MREIKTPTRSAAVSIERLPPQSIESEQAVLGGILLDNSAFDRIVDVVHDSDFYRASHRLIFRHIAALIENNRPADALTVAASLGDKCDEVGGQQYIGSLAMNTPSSANIRAYARIVADRAQKRLLIASCTDAIDAAFVAREEPAAGIVEDLEARLFSLHQRKTLGPRLMSAVLSEVVERIDALYSREDKNAVIGLPTGFVDLDHKTAGLQPGDLIVIAGRPSMGKTAIAMNIVEHVAMVERKTAAVFSLEMSDKQLTHRMIGSVGRIDQHALRAGTFQESEWSRITEAVGKLNESRIVIEETFDLAPAVMRARARRLKREYPDLALIVVDYLQLMEGAGDRRVDQVAEISRGLKRIAKELNIPVIALSQLNRSLEQRPNKRPQLSDLRESGAIEQDADLILFLYRDEVYNEDTNAKGIAEVIIGKHRSGPIGMVPLTWIDKFTRFENFAGEMPLPMPRKSSRTNFEDFRSKAARNDG